jgi:dTDP-glucose 4,6-dehydratase
VNPVNIGNPDEITIKEFAEEVIKQTDSKSKIVYKPLPEDDPKVRQPNIERAQKILKWNSKIQREEGLKITIDYFINKINKVRA